jgi:hypothetical protein
MRTVQPDTENRSNMNRSALFRPRLLETLRAPVMCKHAAENITADSLAHRDARAALNYFESISDVILAAMFWTYALTHLIGADSEMCTECPAFTRRSWIFCSPSAIVIRTAAGARR